MTGFDERRPRLCLLVMSHTEPDLVERLVRVLVSEVPDACVVVRHDERAVAFDATRVADLPHVHVRAHRQEAGWGSWTFTQRVLEGVQMALDLDEEWDWLAVISGQSYPVAPLEGLVDHLSTTSSDALLRISGGHLAAKPSWRQWRPDGADRARYRFVRLPWTPLWERHRVRQPITALSRRQPLVTMFLHRDPQSPARVVPLLGWLSRPAVLSGVTPVKASSWWAVRRGTARSLLRMLDRRDPWNRHFRRTFTSDELAVPTFLGASGAVVEDWSLHALSWKPGAPSPDTLTPDHLPWLQGRPEPFTRKVSLADGGALVDALDGLRLSRTPAVERMGEQLDIAS